MAAREAYEFGEFTLDPPERRLSRRGDAIPLAPKAHDLLVALVRNAGRLVTKRELLDLVWPESFVEEGILAVHVSALRKALGDDGRQYIETVSRSGYRFIGIQRQSIAVFPAAGDPLSMGLAIADAVIDRLGRCEQILVRPTRAVHRQSNARDPAAAGRSLQVAAVLDASFVQEKGALQLSCRLIRSSDGARLWSGDFHALTGDAGALADEVAEAVASQIGSNFRRNGSKRAPAPAALAEVCELVGRGRHHLLLASMFEVPKALAAFQAAVALVPDYSTAYAGLALAYCEQAAMHLVAPQVAYAHARASALSALAMDDSSADAQVALGAVLFLGEWNWAAAEKSFQRALNLNPNHTEAYLLYGRLLEALGQLDQGLAMKLRALERDPFSPLVHLEIAVAYWNQRRYDDMIEWANKTLELDPRHPHAREYLAGAYLKKGDLDRHLEVTLQHAEMHGAPAEALEGLKHAYATSGRAGAVQLVLQRAAHNPEAFPAMVLALHYGEAGELNAAFEHLERAIESRDPALVHLAVAPQWDSLRGDPRFRECLTRMGLSGAGGFARP
jgi:DNA-binding winged helix-turn-helix (wHTH) protein/tetratricopeptide (TPR) repeat protein